MAIVEDLEKQQQAVELREEQENDKEMQKSESEREEVMQYMAQHEHAEIEVDMEKSCAELKLEILEQHNIQQAEIIIAAAAQKKGELKQYNNLEQQSMNSGKSKVSRSTSGRFEGKYKVGDKTASGAIIKDIRE